MEGYWLTHYDAGKSHGDGIAILRSGERLGGDLDHVWRGSYEEEGPKLYARIRIAPFVSRPEEETMAREQPMILTLQGYCTEDYARLEGHPDHREDLQFQVEMRKCQSMHAHQPARKAA